MIAIRNIVLFFILITVPMYLAIKCERGKDPYEPGMHFDYSIECENSFVYKTISRHRGTIQVLNSDGTPLKCGSKIY